MNTTIEAALAAGFEKQLYQAAVANLKDSTSPLRLNNFAYAMREVVRHLLARLAPDSSVNPPLAGSQSLTRLFQVLAFEY